MYGGVRGRENLFNFPSYSISFMEKRLFLTSAQPVASECRNLHTPGFHLSSGDKICLHTIFFIDPCNFIILTEVVDTDKFLLIILTYKSKNRSIPGVNGANWNITVEYTVA